VGPGHAARVAALSTTVPAEPRPGEAAAAAPVSDDEEAAALARVRSRLRRAGATDEEIDQAAEEDVLDLLAVDTLLLPAPRRYTQSDVAERTGLPLELLRRLWRALGFSDVAGDALVFTDLDIEAAHMFLELVRLGVTDLDVAFQLARVIGSSMARIAETEVSSLRSLRDVDDVLAADAFTSVADEALPKLAELLAFVWRRHFQAAARRAMLQRVRGDLSGDTAYLAVGFADMVGFTVLSQHLDEEQLAAVVRRFEELSHDIVTALGGRVVKMIGDEAMFVVERVVDAARIGVELANAYADDELLSDVRVGLALGSVLLREGDYFGPTVNLASRIVNIADPGTVVVADAFHEALVAAAPDEFDSGPLRPRTLKDLGRVQLWWCRRKGEAKPSPAAAPERRSRLLRLAEMLQELDELRGVGERAVAGRPADGTPGSDLAETDGGDPEGT